MKSLMLVVCLLIGILLGATGCYAYFILRGNPKSILSPTFGRKEAYNYLLSSYNSTLGLCFEYPGSNGYWVSNDNVLASYALQNWNRTIADNITETIERLVKDYNLPASPTGIPINTRAEILLGYYAEFLINQTELPTLNSSYYGSVLKTEVATNNILLDFENYSDLLCYASLTEWRKGNDSGAVHYYEEVKAMWDGNGFNDKVFKLTGYYATYKLGLFYLTSRTLGKNFGFEKDLIERFSRCQLVNGGFITDYYGNGSFPSGSTTNTETTSIMLLADIPLIFEYN
jgi:hypothetical protein